MSRKRRCRIIGRERRGQSLVEFAIIALALYILVAGTITFGHLLFCAQNLQSAADVAARELARTSFPADDTFEESLESVETTSRIFSKDFLVVSLDSLPTGNVLDHVGTWPIVNQQLFAVMILDEAPAGGNVAVGSRILRYPGALLSDGTTPTGFTVGIPMVESRDADGIETIRWIPIVEEIDTETDDDNTGANPDPFRLTSSQRGLVALRINYPYQSAMLSAYQPNSAGPFEPNAGNVITADDGGVVELNPGSRPGGTVARPAVDGGKYAGSQGGTFGLGVQGAWGKQVRPFRRIISTQAIYRREVFD